VGPGAQVTLIDCTVSSNSAERGGGGVAVEAGTAALLQNCSLSDNTATLFGGAVHGGFLPLNATAALTSIQQCVFQRNAGRGSGTVRVAPPAVRGNCSPLSSSHRD
jgi:hypothetical protein